MWFKTGLCRAMHTNQHLEGIVPLVGTSMQSSLHNLCHCCQHFFLGLVFAWVFFGIAKIDHRHLSWDYSVAGCQFSIKFLYWWNSLLFSSLFLLLLFSALSDELCEHTACPCSLVRLLLSNFVSDFLFNSVKLFCIITALVLFNQVVVWWFWGVHCHVEYLAFAFFKLESSLWRNNRSFHFHYYLHSE